MPIEKGDSWGKQGALPTGAPVAHSDIEGRSIVESAWKRGEEPPPIGLVSGDLCRTVGGRGDIARLTSPDAQSLPCDAMVVAVDGTEFVAIAHCIIRRHWLRGSVTAVMNAAWIGEWNVAPRSHPGDGRLDVVKALSDFSSMDRLRARSRLPHGGHVPHPRIAQSRITTTTPLTVTLERPTPVYVDGDRVAAGSEITVSVLADFFTAVV